MNKYPKIQTLLKRDSECFKATPILNDKESANIFQYLKKIDIEEKIDGTNAHIRYAYS